MQGAETYCIYLRAWHSRRAVIPLRDSNPTQKKPWITYLIILSNVAVFFYQLSLGPALAEFVNRFGVVPAALVYGQHSGSWITPFTSMFMHGGWGHLLGNMWFLFVFGDNIEDYLGKKRYVAFYALSGLVAAMAQIAIDPASRVPMVGASGAIAGVLAGYLVLFPKARVLTIVPIFIFLQFVELPAFILLLLWFAIQLLSGYMSLGGLGSASGGVAFFAHIGGFVAGLVLIFILRGSRSKPRRLQRRKI